jgi:hypothetical protein
MQLVSRILPFARVGEISPGTRLPHAGRGISRSWPKRQTASGRIANWIRAQQVDSWSVPRKVKPLQLPCRTYEGSCGRQPYLRIQPGWLSNELGLLQPAWRVTLDPRVYCRHRNLPARPLRIITLPARPPSLNPLRRASSNRSVTIRPIASNFVAPAKSCGASPARLSHATHPVTGRDLLIREPIFGRDSPP